MVKKDNINVLVIYHYFPHYRLPLFLKMACDKLVEFTFLSGLETDQEIKTIDPVLAITPINQGGLKWKFVKNFWLFRKKFLWQSGLLRECAFGNYDAIIFLGNPYFLSTWLGLFFSKLLGKRTFIWAHGIIRSQKRDKLKLLFFKMADHLLLYGNHAKFNLIKHGFDPKKISVIYNSLNYEFQLELRNKINPEVLYLKKKSLFSEPENPTLLFIGRLTAVKKLHELIYVCEKLISIDIPVNLLFIGDGPEKDNLITLVVQKGLQEKVFFYGECYDENEIAPLIALSDICISPGNVGLTAMHSLMYGTPVITHDNPFDQMPEFEAIKPEISGMLFEYGSLDSLIDSIVIWLRKYNKNRENIRSACYEIIDHYYNPDYQMKVLHEALLKEFDIRGYDEYYHEKFS